MMPNSLAGWLWFIFFFFGSAGGWIALAGFVYVLQDEWKKRK